MAKRKPIDLADKQASDKTFLNRKRALYSLLYITNRSFIDHNQRCVFSYFWGE